MAQRPLIDIFLEHMARKGRAESTVDTYGYILRSLDRSLPMGIEQATDLELSEVIYTEDASKSTWHSRVAAVRMFFRFATNPRDAHLDFDPSLGLETPRVPEGEPRPITMDQLDYVLANADDTFRQWCVLAAFAGLRCLEIANLHRQDVTRPEMRVTGKGGKRRVVPTHELVWSAINLLPPGPVARRIRDGLPANRTYISGVSARRFDQLGMPDVTMHRLRHTFGTEVQRRYKNLRVVQRLMGHASLATTAIYTAVADDELRAAVAMLPTTRPGAAAGAWRPGALRPA